MGFCVFTVQKQPIVALQRDTTNPCPFICQCGAAVVATRHEWPYESDTE